MPAASLVYCQSAGLRCGVKLEFCATGFSRASFGNSILFLGSQMRRPARPRGFLAERPQQLVFWPLYSYDRLLRLRRASNGEDLGFSRLLFVEISVSGPRVVSSCHGMVPSCTFLLSPGSGRASCLPGILLSTISLSALPFVCPQPSNISFATCGALQCAKHMSPRPTPY